MVELNNAAKYLKELGVTHFYFSTPEHNVCPRSICFDLVFDTILFSETECSVCLRSGINTVRFDYITATKFCVDDNGIVALHLRCNYAGSSENEYIIFAA